MAFGYVQDLISDEIPDPIAYYTDFVAEKIKNVLLYLQRILVHVLFLLLWNIILGIFSSIHF